MREVPIRQVVRTEQKRNEHHVRYVPKRTIRKTETSRRSDLGGRVRTHASPLMDRNPSALALCIRWYDLIPSYYQFRPCRAPLYVLDWVRPSKRDGTVYREAKYTAAGPI